MLVIGIAGGIASGKSLVTDCFQHFGATVLDGDQIGHKVLQQIKIVQQLVDHFGDGILSDGQIDRSRLAQIVFAKAPEGPLALKKLEAITHPRIGEQIVFVEAPLETRYQRARDRGWDSDELANREKNQTDVETKRQRATDIINNANTKESTFQQASQKWLGWGLNLPKDLHAPSSLFNSKQ